ncbi:TetR/AcrR family transcriptional regulator [Sporosarcina sp. GW1-11]|uniref:TetR/AcrR family transcriptional regulator n=1 Tax=Sporosarcina sp. GW1-11 TaxID=2899126 RepID=UPI00294FE4A7|nr:TetR/AcrR family transcriptional regulator [Sporosarcina sp. GW1-11]MDV6378767.1 TetR/AcrR family transcriptional regulator [Sporosarcina sp. GW1-11]
MNRREEIMLAAEKSFTMFGYKATTMDQVAKIANVGKGTIYTFFATKEELFHSIVWKMVEEMKDVSERSVVVGASFQENAHARIMQVLKFRETHQLFIKLIQEEKELRTPAVGEVLKTIEQEILKYIASKIDRGVAKGELKPCNSELIAYLLYKSYLALVVDWNRTHDEQLTEEQITDVLNDTIFSSLLV